MSSTVDELGVLRLVIQSAYISRWCKWKGCLPDPFVVVKNDRGDEVGRTKIHRRSIDPTWMEIVFVILTDTSDQLVLCLYNHHRICRDALIGKSQLSLIDFKKDRHHAQMLTSHVLPLWKHEKLKGEILLDVVFYPIDNDAKAFSLLNGRATAGIVLLRIQGVRHLGSNKKIKLHVNLDLEFSPVHTSKRITRPDDFWFMEWRMYYDRRSLGHLNIRIVEDDLSGTNLGELNMPLQDLLEASHSGVTWWPLTNSKAGQLMVNATWFALQESTV